MYSNNLSRRFWFQMFSSRWGGCLVIGAGGRVETWILLVASVVTMVELQSCSLALHCVTTCILKLKIGQKFSCMTINFNLQAHGTRPTQESFFSRPTLFFWVWVCKELLRLVEPSGHWSRREASQLLSRDLLQRLCRSSSDVKTNTNTQKCKVQVFRFYLIVL